MRSFVLRGARLHLVSQSNKHDQSFLATGRKRRSGQALLLAVLLMIFVALVGTTFITVVALNIDATASQEERQRAASAATAGINTVNYQINANGTSWRPEQVASPPAPGDSDYSFYWTAQDIARGYARTTGHPSGWNPSSPNYAADWAALEADKANGARVFVKFPDPRLEQNTGSHTYMAEVAVASAADGTDKQGMLRVTVVGQSADDPNVFVKKVGYKGTEYKNGAFAWGVFDTNWNYDKKSTVSTEWTLGAAVNANTTNSITVKDARGISPGRMLVLQQGSTVEYVMVSAVNNNTITLKANNTQAYTVGTVSVRAATILMNDLVGSEGTALSPTITPQFDADGETSSDSFEKILAQSRTSNAGYYFNTDVLVRGNARFVLGNNQQMKVAGLLYRYKNLTAPTNESQAQVNASTSPTATPVPMPVSATNPVDPTTTIGSSTLPYAEQKRVYDNPNIGGSESTLSDPLRSVQTQEPPDLSQFTKLLEDTKYQPGGVIGLGPNLYIGNDQDREKVVDGSLRELSVSDMHRLWQGKSFPSLNSAGNVNAGATGGVNSGTTGFRLVYKDLAPPVDNYTYPVTTAFPLANTASLEQRGIRGWISPHEFLPRGAVIELQGNNIVVTLDSASDTNPSTPDASKAWPWAANAPTPMTKCYRMVIDTTTNARTAGLAGAATQATYTPAAGETFGGVIYAEGNVRVRGTSGIKPITIVSMGNIYIEGKLRQGSATGRIALLAKKNVVLNPTQFITRAEGAEDRYVGGRVAAANVRTVSGTGSTADPLVLTCNASDAAAYTLFRIGDWIRVGTGRNVAWRQVESIRPADGALVVTPVFPSAPAANTSVSMLFDPPIVAGSDTTIYPTTIANVTTAPTSTNDAIRRIGDNFRVSEYFYRLGNTTTGQPSSDVFVRNVNLDGLVGAAGSGGSYRLALRCVGERKEAVALQFIGREATPNPSAPPANLPTSLPQTYSISSREDTDNNNTWQSTEDIFQGRNTADTRFPFAIDLHNVTGSSTADTSNLISALKTQFNSTYANKWQLQTPTNSGTYGTAATALYANFMLPTGATGDNAIASRYIARYGQANGIADDWKTNRFPASIFSANYPYTGDEIIKLPLTVSVGLNWQTNLASVFPVGSSIIGTNPVDTASQTAGDVETSQTDFYWFNNADANYNDKQQWLRYIKRTLSAPNPYSNLVALQRDPDTSAVLPALRVGALKLETDDFALPATSRAYTPIEIPIEATIFAQEGSWFVIPTIQQHRTDRDSSGSNSIAEKAEATRFNRMNYKITVTGAIVQNYAPTALEDYDSEHSPDDQTVGAGRQWINAYSYPSLIGKDGAPLASYGSGNDPLGVDWVTIRYDNSPSIPLASGLYLPPSPELSGAS